MKYYLKLIIVYIARFILRVFYIFPVKKNRILFSAYEGLSFTCNPKYIFQYLFERESVEWDFIWCLNDTEQLPEAYRSRTRIVSFLSLRHIYYLMTSGFIISNLGIEPIIPKRKKQVFINTWHGGGAYKRSQPDMEIFSKAESFYKKKMRDIRQLGTDYFISSCRAFSEVYSEVTQVDISRFLPIGLPRNDMFFNESREDFDTLRAQIANQYHLEKGSLWVLYAPTFRGTERQQENPDTHIFNQRVIDCFRKCFGKAVSFITRAHTPHIYLETSEDSTDLHIVDLTDYPDMQELLAVTDVLITDYSSSIWDFALTGRPAFLFTPDLEKYDQLRGFYTPIEQWPYPYAEDIDGICRLIKDYTETKCAEKIRTHQELLGSFETGNATESVLRIISFAAKHP